MDSGDPNEQHPATVASDLAINAGSSSIKFAFYNVGETPKCWLNGMLDRIGQPDALLVFHDLQRGQGARLKMAAATQSAATLLIDWIEEYVGFSSIRAIGHRVVHGMRYSEPTLVTDALLAELRRIIPFDPNHLPLEIELLDALRQRDPKLPQIACFDTAFHSTMPRVARILPIPRRFETLGLQRYGFHGLSYAYLMEELTRVAGAEAADGRVICGGPRFLDKKRPLP